MNFYSQNGGISRERVRVTLWILSLLRHEKGHMNILETEGMNKVYLKMEGSNKKRFRFKTVLSEDTKQQQAFETLRNLAI